MSYYFVYHIFTSPVTFRLDVGHGELCKRFLVVASRLVHQPDQHRSNQARPETKLNETWEETLIRLVIMGSVCIIWLMTNTDSLRWHTTLVKWEFTFKHSASISDRQTELNHFKPCRQKHLIHARHELQYQVHIVLTLLWGPSRTWRSAGGRNDPCPLPDEARHRLSCLWLRSTRKGLLWRVRMFKGVSQLITNR